MTKSAYEKYRCKPFPGSSHTWAMQQLERIPKNARVLDVGSGSGVLGRFLSELGLTELFAIEPDQVARDNTKGIYKQIYRSIEEVPDQKFDLVLLMDVLEHLVDPQTTLANLASRLNPGGEVLISVPNIAHWSVRLPLVLGFFNPKDRGILDKTHLHFFTRGTFLKFLSQCPKLKLEQISSSIEPIEFFLPEWLWLNPLYRISTIIRQAFARCLPGFFAYQHLAKLRAI